MKQRYRNSQGEYRIDTPTSVGSTATQTCSEDEHANARCTPENSVEPSAKALQPRKGSAAWE